MTSFRPRWEAYGSRMWQAAMTGNLENIRDFIASHNCGQNLTLLDLGCGDARNLVRYAPKDAGLHGVEYTEELAEIARTRGVEVTLGDLDTPIQLPGASFDVVTSNQVIEHVADTDLFVAECLRLVKPGGLVVISTENLASWHNVASLVLGWQAFSLSNVSTRAASLGNPLGNFRMKGPFTEFGHQHRRVFSHRGLLELLTAHGFANVSIRGSGYFPLPSRFAHRDTRHAALLAVSGIRPSPGSA